MVSHAHAHTQLKQDSYKTILIFTKVGWIFYSVLNADQQLTKLT